MKRNEKNNPKNLKHLVFISCHVMFNWFLLLWGPCFDVASAFFWNNDGIGGLSLSSGPMMRGEELGFVEFLLTKGRAGIFQAQHPNEIIFG